MLSFSPVMVCLHAEMSSLSGHSWSPSENSMSGRHHNSGMPAHNNHLHGVRSRFFQAFVICVSPPSCCLILAEMILRCAKPRSFASNFAPHFLSCCQCYSLAVDCVQIVSWSAYTPSCNAARCHACHLRIQHDWALVFKPALQLPMGMIIGNGHRDAKATALTHKLAVVYSRLFAHRIEHITYQPLHIFPAQSMQASVCVAVPADLPGENKQTEACGGMRQRRGRCVDFTVFLL